MRAPALAALLVATACASCSSSRQHARLGPLAFDMPSDWQGSETHLRHVITQVWVPDDNDRKESVSVIRSEESAVVATKADVATLEHLLAGAQESLHADDASPISPVSTPGGLHGVRIELDYQPPGVDSTYHRIHVLLVDGPALVHVLYTAKTPDPNLESLNSVLNSLRHQEVQS